MRANGPVEMELCSAFLRMLSVQCCCSSYLPTFLPMPFKTFHPFSHRASPFIPSHIFWYPSTLWGIKNQYMSRCPRVRECTFRLHTLLFFSLLSCIFRPAPSHRTIVNAYGSPQLPYRNTSDASVMQVMQS